MRKRQPRHRLEPGRPPTPAPKDTNPKPEKNKRWAAAFTVLAVLAALPGLTAPAANAAVSPTTVSLTFDDGNANQVDAVNYLNSKGLKGTFYVVSGWVGMTGYLTQANLQAFAAAGNEIAAHTVTHQDLATLSTDEVKRQVCDGRVALHNMGFHPTNFAYPFASQSTDARAAVQACGLNSARGLGDVQSPGGTGVAGVYAETIPPADPLFTKAPNQVENTWTLADLQTVVTNAENNGGGWVQLTFHNIDTTNGQLSISPTIFNQFVDWLAARGPNTTVKTVGDVIGGAEQPYTPGPVAAAPTPGLNGLQNAGLETQTSTGTPQCWSQYTTGVNTSTFANVAGHNGSVAQQLNTTAYTSGNAKIMPTEDLGQCSVTATAGHVYELKTWFTSTAQVQFELQYRNALGQWNYWTSSPFIPASSSWTQATWVTPAPPAGATGFTFALTMPSTGTLTTDDYSVVDHTSPFTDVVYPVQFFDEILWLSGNKITTGWTESDGTRTYRPLLPVARDAMAAFLYRQAGSPAYTPPATSPFRDVTPTTAYYKEINWAYDQKITTGIQGSDGLYYQPLASIGRDAMAAFLYRFAGSPAWTAPATSPFTDITPQTKFYAEITWMQNQGITTGYLESDGTYTFRPLNSVNRDSTAAFLDRFYAKHPTSGVAP